MKTEMVTLLSGTVLMSEPSHPLNRWAELYITLSELSPDYAISLTDKLNLSPDFGYMPDHSSLAAGLVWYSSTPTLRIHDPHKD